MGSTSGNPYRAREIGARPTRRGSGVLRRAARRRRADPRRPVLRHDRLGAALGRRLPPAIRGRSGGGGAATDEILGLVGDIERTLWNVGSSAEPPSLPERLRALGWRDPEPPWDPVVAAMVLAEEPPASDGVEIRRIETFDDHLAGLEIMLASDAFSQEVMARSGRRRVRPSSGARAAAACSGSPSSMTSRSRSRSPIGARSACSSPAAQRSPRRAVAGAIGLSSGRAGTRPWRSACPGSRCRRSTNRRFRSCGGSASSRPPPFTRSGRRRPATEAGTQRSPGGHRGSLAVRAWASALRRGGRSRDARGRRRRSSHRPRCGSPHPRSSTRRTRENP